MKIGLDIRVLMDKYYSGISEYTANLLLAIFRQDKQNNYKLFYNSFHNLDDRFQDWNSANSQVIGRHIPNKLFNYFFQKILAWPKLDKVLGGVDIFWSPHFNFTSLSSASSGFKKILTVHDLSFLRYPEFFSVRKNFWHRALRVKQMMRAADRIVAVSESTKNDIIELVGIAPDKIQVIYPGNNVVLPAKPEMIENINSRGRFILYLGTIEPRKNLRGLLAAYNKLRSTDLDKRFKDVKLVLAGGDGWKNRLIRAAWRTSPYKDDIEFLGYVSQSEKENLYRTAAVFIYPSYYEGFGFPPLEAMTYGVPVICSNVSSLPEVVGEAALMINPCSEKEMATALKIVLTEEAVRTRLIAKGYERAVLFSWDKAALEYLRLFKQQSDAEKNC